RTFHREAAGGIHFAKHVNVARSTRREDRRDFDPFDAELFLVTKVDFLLELVEGETLGGNIVETGQVDGALRCDSGSATLTTGTGTIVDRGTEIVELGVNADRSDRDRRELVVLGIAVVEFAAEFLDSHVRGADFA